MDTLRICKQCHAPIEADVMGSLCPNCLQTPTGIAAMASPLVPSTSSPPPAAQIAEYFPQLEIYEVLGFGGMGMVYKARQLNLDRLVALKILSPELSRQPAFAERFSREAKALARLHHSNIVAVYDFGRAGPYYYFLMEYVDGVDLHTIIQQKTLKPDEALRIVVEICHALQFAHDEGIIHRDIKPANILLDKKGRVKMADFGLAKLVATTGQRQTDLTQTTGLMGTPQYMAPEQIEHPSEVDSRADLYSLGVIFYEMLTGELPLGRFPMPSQKAHTDAKLDQVVLRALEKEPALRYQQASEILTQVEKFSAPGIASARSETMTTFLQIGIATTLVVAVALAYALVHARTNPAVVTRVVTSTNTVTNTVTITNTFLPPGFNRNLLFTNTAEGLSLTLRTISDMQLTADQVQVVNSVIRTTEGDYWQIESRHAERFVDGTGHVHVTIRPFGPVDVAEVGRLGEQMWKEFGGVLNPAQMENARKQAFERALLPLNRGATNIVEIWKDPGGRYHFTDTTESARIGENSRPPKVGPDFNNVVPERFKIYWKENEK